MKITIKTLQQKVFQIDAEGEDTVADVKKRVEDLHGHPVINQKLIYSGKVLPDEKTIEACEIREKDFLVLMVSKPKTVPVSSSSATAPAQPAPPVQPTQPAQPDHPAAELTPQLATPPPEQPAQPQTATGPGDGFLIGGALEDAVSNIVDMGFPRDQVQRAMRASFNNPDRAVEYLMTGIPAHIQPELAPPTPAQQPPRQLQPQPPASDPTPAQQPVQQAAPANLFRLAQQQQQQRQTPGFGGEGGGTPQLSPAQLNNMRQLMARNPEMTQALIQQIRTTNPTLLDQLGGDPEAVINEIIHSAAAEAGESGGGGHHELRVTPEELAAIERLEALGFPRDRVIEAYIACDKNEELAANYLFEDDHEP